MSDRRHFATEKEIWWELEGLAVRLVSEGKPEDAHKVVKVMELLKKPKHKECRRFYARGF